MTPEERLQATIDRLALELADERAEHRRTREELAAAHRRIRIWRRVAEWIHHAHHQETP